ncbi:MAG: hypothetical protein HOQ13_10295, partial [Dermatophilaceae bacterium]|nr:hypothetical protein [Dermatophilaceae bacterium]
MSHRSPAVIAAIVNDYKRGVPVNEIVRLHGTSAESVRTYARRAGIGPRPARQRGFCDACTMSRVLNHEGLCDGCADDVPLTEGRWVRRGLVQVWVENPKPKRQVAAELIACPKCEATVTESCRTKNGHRTNDHLERLTPRLCECGHLPKP